jgi:prophage antirepressor-like protein
MNNMEIFRNKEFGSVRVLKDGDKYLFCGSDVAKALGYARPNDALSRHCRYTAKRSIPHPSGGRKNH